MTKAKRVLGRFKHSSSRRNSVA